MTRENGVDGEPLRTFDWTAAESPSHAVISAIADEAETDPLELPILHGAVDTEALDSLLRPGSVSRTSGPARLQFVHFGYRILLDEHGQGWIYER